MSPGQSVVGTFAVTSMTVMQMSDQERIGLRVMIDLADRGLCGSAIDYESFRANMSRR
jgi:hypothetical protein